MDEVKEQVAKTIWEQCLPDDYGLWEEDTRQYPALAEAVSNVANQIHELYKAKFKEEIEKLSNPYQSLELSKGFSRCQREILNKVSKW